MRGAKVFVKGGREHPNRTGNFVVLGCLLKGLHFLEAKYRGKARRAAAHFPVRVLIQIFLWGQACKQNSQ